MKLRLIQDATGGRNVAWEGIDGGAWLGWATAPEINTDPGGETVVALYFTGDAWRGDAAKVGGV